MIHFNCLAGYKKEVIKMAVKKKAKKAAPKKRVAAKRKSKR